MVVLGAIAGTRVRGIFGKPWVESQIPTWVNLPKIEQQIQSTVTQDIFAEPGWQLSFSGTKIRLAWRGVLVDIPALQLQHPASHTHLTLTRSTLRLAYWPLIQHQVAQIKRIKIGTLSGQLNKWPKLNLAQDQAGPSPVDINHFKTTINHIAFIYGITPQGKWSPPWQLTAKSQPLRPAFTATIDQDHDEMALAMPSTKIQAIQSSRSPVSVTKALGFDLKTTLSPWGTFLKQPNIKKLPPITLDITLDKLSLAPTIKRLSKRIPDFNQVTPLKGLVSGELRLKQKKSTTPPELNGLLSLTQGQWHFDPQGLKNLITKLQFKKQHITITKATGQLQKAPVRLSGSINWWTQQFKQIKLTTGNLPIGTLVKTTLPVHISGQARSNITMDGSVQHPYFTGQILTHNLKIQDAQHHTWVTRDPTTIIRLAGDRIELPQTSFQVLGEPVQVALAWQMEKDQLAGKMNLSKLQLNKLLDALPNRPQLPGQLASGYATGTFTLSGTRQNPQVLGHINVENTVLHLDNAQNPLPPAHLEATFNASSIQWIGQLGETATARGTFPGNIANVSLETPVQAHWSLSPTAAEKLRQWLPPSMQENLPTHVAGYLDGQGTATIGLHPTPSLVDWTGRLQVRNLVVAQDNTNTPFTLEALPISLKGNGQWAFESKAMAAQDLVVLAQQFPQLAPIDFKNITLDGQIRLDGQGQFPKQIEAKVTFIDVDVIHQTNTPSRVVTHGINGTLHINQNNQHNWHVSTKNIRFDSLGLRWKPEFDSRVNFNTPGALPSIAARWALDTHKIKDDPKQSTGKQWLHADGQLLEGHDDWQLKQTHITIEDVGSMQFEGHLKHPKVWDKQLFEFHMATDTPFVLDNLGKTFDVAKGLTGKLDGQLEVMGHHLNDIVATGELNLNKIAFPYLKLRALDGTVKLNGIQGKVDINKFKIPGVHVAMKANIEDVALYPLALTQVDITGPLFVVSAWQQYTDKIIQKRIVQPWLRPLFGPPKPEDPFLPIEFRDARVALDEVIYDNILIKDAKGTMHLASSGFLELVDIKAKTADGKIVANISLNPKNNHYVAAKINADQVQANALARTLLEMPNQIFGRLSGEIDFTTQGTTHNDMMSNVNGAATFTIEDGRLPAIAKIETLLTTANVIRGGVLGLNLNNLVRTLSPFETNYFAKLSGDFSMVDGMMYTKNTRSNGKNLDLLITGEFRLLDGWGNLAVLGTMNQDVSGVFGKLGKLSVRKLISWIPFVGWLPSTKKKSGRKGGLLSKIPGVGYTPGLGGSVDGRKQFEVRIKGPLGDETKAVQEFRWLD